MPDVPYRVEKPWGHELIWARTDRYVGKMLHVKAGHVLSLQYHNKKDETMHVLTGELILRTRPRRRPGGPAFRAGESVHIPAGLVHQIEAVVDSDVLEASTPELDDLVRLSRPLRRGADHAGDHSAGRQGHPPPSPHPPRSQADAQGGGPPGHGLGDGPARGARRHRADLHHRPPQGAGRGLRDGPLRHSLPVSSSRRCRTAPPAPSTWRGRS